MSEPCRSSPRNREVGETGLAKLRYEPLEFPSLRFSGRGSVGFRRAGLLLLLILLPILILAAVLRIGERGAICWCPALDACGRV